MVAVHRGIEAMSDKKTWATVETPHDPRFGPRFGAAHDAPQWRPNNLREFASNGLTITEMEERLEDGDRASSIRLAITAADGTTAHVILQHEEAVELANYLGKAVGGDGVDWGRDDWDDI